MIYRAGPIARLSKPSCRSTKFKFPSFDLRNARKYLCLASALVTDQTRSHEIPERENVLNIRPAKLITTQRLEPGDLDHSAHGFSEGVANELRSCAVIVGIPVQNEARTSLIA